MPTALFPFTSPYPNKQLVFTPRAEQRGIGKTDTEEVKSCLHFS